MGQCKIDLNEFLRMNVNKKTYELELTRQTIEDVKGTLTVELFNGNQMSTQPIKLDMSLLKT